MKVDNPRFSAKIGLLCPDCPFEYTDICRPFDSCPTKENYAESCSMMDKATAAHAEGE